MAYRLMITAELNNWRLNGNNNGVTGTIHNSTDEDYVDGDEFAILNMKHMSHYPSFKTDVTDSEEHWLIQTYSNKFFLLYKSQMR